MWKSCRTKKGGGIVFLIILIVVTGIIPNTSNAQVDTPWDVSRESYVYNYLQIRKTFDIDGTSGGDKTYTDDKTVEMWEVNSTGNEITFRTNNLERFLGCVNCDSIECYQEYKDAWQYDEEDDSLTVTYLFNKTEGELGFIDPILGTFLCYTMEIPINPIKLPDYFFGLWEGMGFVFLPVLDEDFSFVTDFQNYSIIYDDFSIHVDDTFTFAGKKFEGYSYEIEYTIIDDRLGRQLVYYDKYSYNLKGILYDYYGKGEHYITVEGDLKRYSCNELQYSIDSIDEDLIVGVHWPLNLLGFVIIIVIWKKNNRKNRFESVTEN